MIKAWMMKPQVAGGYTLSDGVYAHRKYRPISRASGAVENYQMKLFVGESTVMEPWISPEMTSDSAPSPYAVSASSTFSGSYPAWNAMTKDAASTSWVSGSGITVADTAWWKVYHSTPIMVNDITIQCQADKGFHAFKLQGSNNDSDWTDIYTGNCDNVATIQTFLSIGNNSFYNYHRLLCITGYDATSLVVNEIGMTGFIESGTNNVSCDGHCLPSFNDLRFTATDGETFLDYCIESITGTTPNQVATTWVEISDVETDAANVFCYYGNPDAEAYSNGANTLIKSEDFEWGANGDNVNTSGGSITWTVDAGTPVISTALAYEGSRSLKLTYSNSISHCLLTASANQAIQFLYYKPDNGAEDSFFVHGNGSKRIYILVDANENVKAINAGGTPVDTTLDFTKDAWNFVEIKAMDFTAGTFTLTVNSNTVTSVAMNNSANQNGQMQFRGNNYTGGECYLDNLIVRHWLAVEPAWSGSWSVEE